MADAWTDGADPVHRGYQAAAARFCSALGSGATSVSRRYHVADRQVVVRFIGGRLAAGFEGPWQHLVESSDEAGTGDSPELAIDLWHRAETGVDAPDATCSIDPLSRFPYQASADDRFVAMRQPETMVWLDRESRHLVGVVNDVDRRTLYEAGRPLETLLLFWLRDEGVPLVHASFVAHRGRGALVVGRSGSGKSTLAAACLCAGFEYLGDDKIALSPMAGGGFIGWSLNGSLYVDAGSLAYLPVLAGRSVAPGAAIDDKYLVAPERVFPERLRRSARVRALLLPSLEPDAGGRVERASKRDAFLALSLSTVLSLPITRTRSLDPLGALTARVPAFRFGVNPLETAPERLAALLGDLEIED